MNRKFASATSAGRLKADGPTEDNQIEDEFSRRHALISIAKYAAYITPAMTVLIRGDDARANHKCPNMAPPSSLCLTLTVLI